MLERDMENLIAAYPADFFPRHNLTLEGRQVSFRGVGRFDLLFCDQFGFNVLMELKAVPARYEDASQLAKYRDAMLARGNSRILMWLVAPSIPASVREFLDHVGIEHTEIHFAEFEKVAGVHGYQFRRASVSDRPSADEDGAIVADGKKGARRQSKAKGIRSSRTLPLAVQKLEECQLSDMLNVIQDYVERPYDRTMESYLVPSDMHRDRVIPYSYFSRRLSQKRAFQNDVRGPALTLRWVLSQLVASGVLTELQPKQVSNRYKRLMRAYRVSGTQYAPSPLGTIAPNATRV